MSFLGFGRTQLPFDMFDLERSAREAQRSEKLASLYHRGQALAWDGREVLAELVGKHGGIKLGGRERQALQRVFAMILWGELAAWKISAQLADRLVPIEAKLAATSQAHDEARHFYVMVDYLRMLGYEPSPIDRPARAVLDLVLETDDTAKKLVGMQLQIETLALTIFQAVRESNVEPVLCDLLRYYEKDEARHVGLGIQYLPSLVKRMTPARALSMLSFQLRIIGLVMWELKTLEPELEILGLDTRKILFLGKAKQLGAYEALWAQAGGPPPQRDYVSHAIDGIGEWMFATPENRGSLRRRLGAALRIARTGRAVAPEEIAA